MDWANLLYNSKGQWKNNSRYERQNSDRPFLFSKFFVVSVLEAASSGIHLESWKVKFGSPEKIEGIVL